MMLPEELQFNGWAFTGLSVASVQFWDSSISTVNPFHILAVEGYDDGKVHPLNMLNINCLSYNPGWFSFLYLFYVKQKI